MHRSEPGELAHGGPEGHRAVVVAALAATTAANVGFLAVDPRMGALAPLLAAAFLIGGAAYVAAIPLCLARRREGFALSAVLGILGAALALADNASISGSSPNEATFALNAVVLVLQVPLVGGGALWLRGS